MKMSDHTSKPPACAMLCSNGAHCVLVLTKRQRFADMQLRAHAVAMIAVRQCGCAARDIRPGS